MAAQILLEKPQSPQAGAVTPGRKKLGETQRIAAFLQAGAALPLLLLLLPPSPAQQQHLLGMGGGKPTGRWDKQEGSILLPINPATTKSLPLHLSGAGLGWEHL